MTKNKIIIIFLITFLIISALGLIIVSITKNYILKEVNLVVQDDTTLGVPAPGFEDIEEMIVNETANWQTYRNEEFEFEFRYPDEFNTEKQEPVIYSGYDVENLSNDFKFVIKQSDNSSNLILWIAISSREFLEFQSDSIVEPPIPPLEEWDLEKEFLTKNSKDSECSFLFSGKNICRIVERNDIIMLDRIRLWSPGNDSGRYLTFYSDKFRYDIVILSSEFLDILPAGYEFSFNGLDNPLQDSFIELSNQILSTFKFLK